MREGRNSAVHYVNQKEIQDLQKKVLHLNCLTGLYYPLDPADDRPVNRGYQIESLPVPPEDLRHGYGTDDESYLASGKHHHRLFNAAFERHRDRSRDSVRILDFGCSSGRIARFFATMPSSVATEVWGCDIDAASIDWCQKNMMPPIKFFTNTTSPHLPIHDSFFDFIYAGSVFTHMNEMTAAWLLELSRCTRPDGIAVFTIHSEASLDYIYAYEFDESSRFSKTSKTLRSWGLTRETLAAKGNLCFESSAWWLSAWYSEDFFSSLCRLGFDVIEIIPSFYGYQTAVVLRKAK